ncbi:c-type cytochrome [bacterium]|nr:c-type cytochrome [bacterium]
MRSLFSFTACFAIAITLFSPPRAGAQKISSATDAVKTGAALYTELRCGLCHDIPASGINIPPSLANAGDKFQTAWLEAYLKSPHRRRWMSTGVRPTLRMPNFLLNDEEAQALAAFLSTQRDTTRIKKLSLELNKNDSTNVTEGKQIFQEYACYGCHKIAGQGGDIGPDLDGTGSRFHPEYLAAFLRNPQAFISGSPMKVSELWDEEVQALVAYLMSLKESQSLKSK